VPSGEYIKHNVN